MKLLRKVAEQMARTFTDVFDADLGRADMNQEKLSKELKVSQQSISQWRRRNVLPVLREAKLADLMFEKLGEKSELYALHKAGKLRELMDPFSAKPLMSNDVSQFISRPKTAANRAVLEHIMESRKPGRSTRFPNLNKFEERRVLQAKYLDKLKTFIANMSAASDAVVAEQTINLRGGFSTRADLVIHGRYVVELKGLFEKEEGLLPPSSAIPDYFEKTALAALASAQGMDLFILVGTAGYSEFGRERLKKTTNLAQLTGLTVLACANWDDADSFIQYLIDHPNGLDEPGLSESS